MTDSAVVYAPYGYVYPTVNEWEAPTPPTPVDNYEPDEFSTWLHRSTPGGEPHRAVPDLTAIVVGESGRYETRCIYDGCKLTLEEYRP